MAKKVQLMTNVKEWQTVNGVEALVDVPQEDLDPITDSSCVEIEGHRTLEETISQENMFTPEIVETKVHSKVGGVYHDNVVDGAYEEAILYGNTQVNLVESVTSGSKYIPHSFTSFQGNESKIGNYHSGRTNQVAPLVKGVTMVNLCQETSVELTQGQSLCIENIKGNTEYTVSFIFTQKNSQAGIVIQSYNGETYLENSKLQSDLGDEVVMTFITHENANKIYINNGVGYGGETIQLDNIMVIEGDVTDLDLPFFKGMRSVELSRPLTNLFTDDLRTESLLGGTATNSGGTVVTTAESIGTWKGMAYFLDNKLKPNTKYLVMWDSLTQTQTSTTNADVIIGAYHHDGGTVTTRLGKINDNSLCPVMRSIVFDTGNYDVTQISIRVHATLSNSETGTTTVTGLRVFEWDDSLRTLDLQTIGYFSGTKYVSAPKTLETEGKNLYPYGDVNFTNNYVGWCDAKGKTGMYGDIAQKSSTRFLLKKGTYTFSIGSATNVELIYIVDDKEQQVGHLGQELKTFTLAQDTYCTIRVKTIEANVATTVTNIQIERGETATTYEGYSSRYYKPRETEEIILRSLPNGVCDTFNLQTGELVQNIGEVVLDGNEDEDWLHLEFSGASTVNGIADTYICYGLLLKHKGRLTGNMTYGAERHVIDTLNISSVYGDTCNQADISTEMVCVHQNGRFYLRLRKDRFASANLAGWKLWFSQNPITVQYELAEPIITKLQTYARVYSGQTNALVGIGNNLSALSYRYSTDYLKVANLSPIPAILEPITTIPYDVRLKPSTLYTIKYNRGGNSNSMKFDLGGSAVEKTNAITDLTGIAEELTVRTPAILSHEQLILSGTGFAHNFIVVEGDITGTELPYFEGMKDVKMPIVKNIGKNLLKGFHEWSFKAESQKPNITIINDYTATLTNVCRLDSNKIKNIQGKTIQLSFNGGRYYILELDKLGSEIRSTMVTTSPKTLKIGHDTTYVQISLNVGTSYTFPLTTTYPLLQIIDNNNAVNAEYSSYRENSVYAVQGEYPITSKMIEQGGFSVGENATISYEESKTENTRRLRSKDLIPVKPNTTYHIDATNMGGQLVYNVYQWNGNRGFMEGYTYTNNDYKIPFTFTTTADTQYIHILCSKYGNGAIAVAEYDWSQFHMYELDSTINLRSLPNGVKDELNLLTGEYIQRVGEVVVDGSGDYTEHIHASSTHYGFRVPVTLKPKTRGYETYPRPIICDKLPSINYSSYFNGVAEGVSMYEGESTTITSVYVSFDRNRINMPQENNNIDHVKEYCKTNPLTIQYELAEPIISHVRLVSNNQEREVGVKLPNGVCNTYNPSTGITTVRVGKVVLDGSEDEGWGTAANNTGGAFRFETQVLSGKFNGTTKDTEVPVLLCDKYAAYKFYYIYNGEKVGIAFYMSSHIVIYDNKYADLASFKQALQSNPITVWYELKYPQIQPDIVLPNGVHDEYNPETGVYTKRVGFVELDGSEDETWYEPFGLVNTTPTVYSTWTLESLPNVKRANAGDRIPGVCNSLKFHNGFLGESDFEMYFISETGRFNLNIERAKLSSGNSAGLNQYLSQNPIKLWYELQTPITYQLTPYFGLPQPYAYEDGYLIHDSAYPETTLPPEFKYKLVANRTGQVMQNNRKLQEHTTRLSNLEALIIEATIESLFNRELQLFELELMDIQLIDLGE